MIDMTAATLPAGTTSAMHRADGYSVDAGALRRVPTSASSLVAVADQYSRYGVPAQVVRFANGHSCTVGKERWTIAAGGRVIATRSQVAGMPWHASLVFMDHM